MLGKGTQPSHHPPHQPTGGKAGVPPRAATLLLPTCAFQLGSLIGHEQRESRARPGSRCVMPNSSLGGGEQLGVCC